MANYLDNESTFEKYDPSGVLASIGGMPDQILQAWEEVGAMKLPRWKPNAVVISGMGGSGLGPHIIQTAFGSRVRVPIIVSNGYSLPGHANQKTLAISVSYSGDTEETLDAYKDSIFRHTKMFVITKGGALGERASSEEGVHLYKFKPKHNPCGKPRTGIGYPLGAILALIRRFKLSNFISNEITDATEHLRRVWRQVRFETPFSENPAKQLASRLEHVVPILIGSRFLGGAVHAGVNMFHENAKHFAMFHRLPEMNHHVLEAWSFPQDIGQTFRAIFFDTALAKPMIRQRTTITRDVLTRHGVQTEVWKLRGNDALSVSLELVMLCGAASVYLALLHKVNPGETPWVDYFKKHLH